MFWLAGITARVGSMAGHTEGAGTTTRWSAGALPNFEEFSVVRNSLGAKRHKYLA